LTTQKDEQPGSAGNESPDELFEWIATTEAPVKSKDNTSLTSPLRTLKTIIWSIDWEISDHILKMLNEELSQLKLFYHEDETVIKFLQLMEAVGRYIKRRKGKSHPESVSLLRELFVELERIVFMLGLSESERKAILNKQIEKFNALKKKLAASKTAESPPKKTTPKTVPPVIPPVPEKRPPVDKPVPEKKPPVIKAAPPRIPTVEKTAPVNTRDRVMTEVSPEVFRQMLLEEMRLVIRYEFKKIKAELLELMENKSAR
jgi:hypothetical protein